MTRRFFPVLMCAVVSLVQHLPAQLLQSITARELLPQVEARAKNDLGNDAFPTNIFFAAVDYQGVQIRMDLSSGKATGWVYRWYASSIDSAELLLAVKPLIGGPIVLPLGTDTIARSLPFNVGTTPLTEPWVDSPEALDGSKSGGGASFIQRHPDARMALAVLLRNPAPTPNLPIGEYWLFMYTAADDTLTCLVYADSGDPLRCLSNKAPVITTLPRTIATVGELYTYDVNARGEPDPVYVLERAPSGMTIDSASGVITWVPAPGQEGLHDVSVEAVNVYGSDRQEFQVQVRAGTMAPKITSSPVTEVRAGDIYVYTLAASGTPVPSFELTRGPSGMILDAGRGVLTWQPSRAESGEHDVEIVARNTFGADTQRFVLSVVSEPRLQPIADQTTTVGNLFSIQAVADGYPLPTYSLVIAPQGMTVDSLSGMISWVPGVSDTGISDVVVEARNRIGTHAQGFRVHVGLPSTIRGEGSAGVFALSPVYPNPAALSSGLSFTCTLPARAPVRFRVFNIVGEEIRVCRIGVLDGGSHVLHWDGRDARGVPVPPGLYLLEISTGDLAARKVAVVR